MAHKGYPMINLITQYQLHGLVLVARVGVGVDFILAPPYIYVCVLSHTHTPLIARKQKDSICGSSSAVNVLLSKPLLCSGLTMECTQ